MKPSSTFADRIVQRAGRIGSWLVVGLDPDLTRLPAQLVQQALEQPAGIAELIFRFNQAVIRGAEPQAVAFKPQAAFYEQCGMAGMEALGRTLEFLRSHELPIILDGKRNDIGSTASAYARAWLASERTFLQGHTLPNDWRCDAITVSPYLGRDGIRPFVQESSRSGAGLFLLLRTSNPSGSELQCARLEDGRLLWEELAALIAEDIETTRSPVTGLSPIGVVVGATLPPGELAAAREALPHSLFLMPGLGPQGARIEDVRKAVGTDQPAVLPASSRSVLYPEGGKGAWADGGQDREGWLSQVQTHARTESCKFVEALRPLLSGPIQ